VIVCGWGRVGREVAHFGERRHDVVLSTVTRQVPRSPTRTLETSQKTAVLLRAGIGRAGHALLLALDTDADNLYVTVASKSMRPELQIIARAGASPLSPSSSGRCRSGGEPPTVGGDRMAPS